MSYQRNTVFLPKDAARYPSLDRLTAALQVASGHKPLETLASACGDLDKSVGRHQTTIDLMDEARKALLAELQSDEIAHSSVPVVRDGIAQPPAKHNPGAELAEAEAAAIDRVTTDVEASIFDYQPQTDREALNQMRFLCIIVDYLGADELARFVNAVKTATDVLWEPGQRLS
ncbi:MAG: hypothetical protein AAF376_04705 [Pseudomonadota bacterium]